MKMQHLFLTLFLTICFSSTAQVDAFHADIIDYINNNGTRAQYSDAYESMFDVIKKQFEVSNVPDEVWTELKNDKEKSIDEIVNLLAYAYRKHFTQEDIKGMNSFYGSETGQQMMNDPSLLSTEQNEEVAAFMSSELGLKIEAKREGLSQDIVTISEQWSRELFMDKMGVLVKKGYHTGY